MAGLDEVSELLRRSDETPRYSQAELDRARNEVRSEERDRMRDITIAELKGAVNQLPATFEATARRVFDEMMNRTREVNSNQRWRRADTLILLSQAMLSGAAVFGGLLAAGKI